MRVLISTGLFYPAKLGGPANTLYWLSKALVSIGIEVSAVVTDHTVDPTLAPSNRWINLDGIQVRYCSKRTPFGCRQVISAIREIRNCDVILLSSICYLPNMLVFMAARLRGKIIIWSPRGELFPSAINNSKQKRLYFAFLRTIISSKVVFHATSEPEKEQINYYFPKIKQVVIIPNYFELPKKEERSTTDNPYFLYVGRITPIKALDNLIRGLAMSKQFQSSGHRFLFVGPNQNDYRDYLKSLSVDFGIQSKVSFCDGLYGTDKYKAYANADFSFLVSHSENFGNVVIEALSQGTPVVASKGTPWELLQAKGAGYWIENDPQSIANCVDNLLQITASDYCKMRQAAEQLAQSFDIKANIGSWVDFLQGNSNHRFELQ